ncbi:MAG: hypothetical protein NZ658_09080, partial [Pirellulales bacterium]|nr:hypothetical protein [Pirellulales bacterium]
NSGGAPVYLSLRASNSIDIAAFSTGILVDPGALSVDAIIYSGPIDAAFADGNLGSGGANFGVLFSDDLSNVLPAGINRTLLQIGISLSPSAQPGLHPVALGTFGQPPVGPEYATATGGTIIPEVNDGGIAIIGDAAPGNQSNVIGVAVADAASPNLLFHTVDPAGNIVSTEVLNASGGELEVIAVGTDGNGNRVVLAEETSGGITSGRLFIGANAQMSTTTSVDIGPRPSFATLTVGIDGACFAGDGEGDLTAVAADGLLLYGEGGLLGGHIGLDPGPIGATALATGGDSLWVCAGDHLMRLTGPGNVAVDSDLGPGSLPSALAALEDGTVIVALRGAGAIEHRAADGSLICAYDLGGGAQPAGIVILTGGGDCMIGASYATNTMYEIDRTTGTVTSFPIVSGGNGMTVDAAGNTWVSAASAAGGGTLTAYDATGAVVGGLDFPEAPFVTGEASGLPFALIHERDGDEDGDGYNNGSECDASSNPYDPLDDPTSVDNTFVPAVTTLGALIVGDVAGGGFQVVLNWTWESPLDPNPDNYLVTRITDGDPDHHQ